MDIAPLALSLFGRTEQKKAAESGDTRLTSGQVTLLKQIGQSASAVNDSVQATETCVQEVIQVSELVSDAIGQLSENISVQLERTQATGRVVDELTTTIEQISASAQDQANSAQRVSERVGHVASRLENVAAKADQVAVSASSASVAAKDGGAVVLRATEKMRQIRGTVLDSAHRMEQLSFKSKHIGSINQTITRIAQQTNLLALNAAIEAARAGSHGKGFAVVADEVRKLAKGAADAAREINDLLVQIQTEVATIVGVMERGRVEVEEGVTLAGDAGTALQAMLTQAEATATDAGTISTAVQDISLVSHEFFESVTLMAAIAEENMAATVQMHAGAEQVRTAFRDVAGIGERNMEAGHDMYAAMAIISGVANQLNALSGQTVTGVGKLSREVKALLTDKGQP